MLLWGRGLRTPRLHDGERVELVERNLWALGCLGVMLFLGLGCVGVGCLGARALSG